MKYTEELRDCPICGSGMHVKFKTKPRWTPCFIIKEDETGYPFHMTDVMCTSCGLIYKNPMLSTKSMKDFYSGPYADLFKPGQQDVISKNAINEGILTGIYVLDWFRNIGFPLKGKKVFELGTGLGLLMKGMEGEGAEVYGIDADSRSTEIANKLFGFKFAHTTFQDWNITDHLKKYDLAVCNNTLEHFYNPVWVLSNLQRVIKDDGRILIELPDARYPYPGTLTDAFLSSAHNFTVTRESIDNLAHQAGLSIEKIDNAGHKNCFLAILKKDPKGVNLPIVRVDTELLREELLSLYREIDTIMPACKAFVEELSKGIYVNSIIYRIKEDHPNTYNLKNITIANSLLEQGRPLDGLKLLKEYGPNQPEDVNTNYGTFLYIQAMIYRQMGDFVTSKNLLEECANHYPNIRQYNFVKDLEIDGLVSNSTFAQFFFWNAERILQSYG